MGTEYHKPVLLRESIEELITDEDGVYVDVTFGGGGHSSVILDKLSAKGRLMVFDQDGDATRNHFDDQRLIFVKSNFRFLYRFWRYYDLPPVSGVLADLGVSSYQLDTEERGFSYRFEADLDMRMNEASTLTAQYIVNNYDAKELQNIFSSYGEIKNSRKLAKVITEKRQLSSIRSTHQLNQILDNLIVGDKAKYFAQVYQALRMEVNDELGSLKEMLGSAIDILKKDGKLVVISYHSIEDRVAKCFMKTGNEKGKREHDEYGRDLSPIKMKGKIIIPTPEEVEENPRSRSAKMRVGVKQK